MARCAVQRAILVRRCRLMVGADRVAGTQALSVETACEDVTKAARQLDESSKGALFPSRRCVD